MFRLLFFRKSKNSKKKYDAIIYNNKTKKYKVVSFGAIGYQQYKDKTGLNIYSHLDHLDKERRRLYRLRHQHTFKKKFSPSYFSFYYLW